MNTTKSPLRFRAPGGWLSFTRDGSGDPILLIHGLGCSRRTWRHLIPQLARTRTVLAIDLPGHGQSDPPAGEYSPSGFATAVRDALDYAAVPRCDLVGHSMGGGVAMAFAHMFPERVGAMTLISSGGFGREVAFPLRAVTLPGAQPVLALLGRTPQPAVRAALAALSHVPGPVCERDVPALEDCFETLRHPGTRGAFVRTAQSVIDMSGQIASAEGQLADLANRPTLLIWGADDRVIPPSHQRQLAARLPHARTMEVPGAGHFPHESSAAVVATGIEDLCRTRT